MVIFMFVVTVLGGVSAAVYVTAMHFGRRVVSPPSDPRLDYQVASGPRGTVDIVWVCLGTLTVCIATSLHVNVPPKPQGRRTMARLRWGGWLVALWRLGYWMVGLLAPEYIVLVAIEQFVDVEIDIAFMQRERFARWTRKHAFFMRMAGLRLKGSDDVARSRQELFSIMGYEDARSLFTQLDYQRLRDDIEDKSKADVIAKTLVVVQISTFLVGTITRAVQHLPISPLEYVTCAYVVCALLLYTLWSQKPYDIQEAIFLDYYVEDTAEHTKRGPDDVSKQADDMSNADVVAVVMERLQAFIIRCASRRCCRPYGTNSGPLAQTTTP